MLRPSGEIRLFGLRYATVLAILGLAAICLTALLIFHVPPAKNVPLSSDLDQFLITQFNAGWTRVLIIGVLLAVTAAAAILTAYSYIVTREKLSQVQETAKAILKSLAWGVLTIDPRGRITIMNRAASDMMDLDAEPPYPDLETLTAIHPVLGGLVRKALDDHDYAQDHDSVFVNSKGTRLVLRTTISEQRDEAGRRVGIIMLVKEVSKLVEMEEELRKRHRLAAAGTLAAGVAHEIRNPLSALELNLRLLRDEIAELSPPRTDLGEYCDVLFAEAKRLNRITSSFLQLSGPEPLSKTLLQVRDPVERVVYLLRSEAREKGISFVLDFPAADIFILGDSTKLEQVCLNILINAMQAMPSGGVIRVSCTVAGVGRDKRVNLAFADQGVGIAPQNVPRLFDPYFTTRSGGTGLGLAIADRIVTDHGGKVLVESSIGNGATITVSLPMASRDAVAAEEGART